MLVVYNPVFSLAEDANNKTGLSVSEHGEFLISLRSKTFEVDYDDGKASVDLHRHMTIEEAVAMAKAILDNVESQQQYQMQESNDSQET